MCRGERQTSRTLESAIAITPEENSYHISENWVLRGVRLGGAGGPILTERLLLRYRWLAAA